MWDNKQAKGSTLVNAFTRRMRMIVLESGPSATPGAWVTERRNLLADYRRAFGDEAGDTMPDVVAVAISADADNTQGHGLAYFSDLDLRSVAPRAAPARMPADRPAPGNRRSMDDFVALLIGPGRRRGLRRHAGDAAGRAGAGRALSDRRRRAVGGRPAVLRRRVLAAALAGNLLGDGAWFLAGRRWGYRVMRLLCRISLSADSCVQRSESILGRWGGASLIAAKFVPGVSVVAPPMAGALHMSNTRFLAYETLAALIWTLGFLLLGRVFHAAIADVLAVLVQVGLTAAAVIALLLAGFVAWRYRLRRVALRGDDIERIEVAALRQACAAGGAAPAVIDVRAAEARALDARAHSRARSASTLRHLPHAARGLLADGRELVAVLRLPRRRQRPSPPPAC